MQTVIESALIIAYARPKNLKPLIESLQNGGIRELFISIDGPANLTIARLQEDMIREIRSNSYPDLKITIRQNDTNLGVAKGVLTAIDWFFQHNQAGLILEDDIAISKNIFPYLNWALNELPNLPNCLFVGSFVVNKFRSESNTPFLCQYPMIWGWATNRQNWKTMREMITAPKNFIRDLFLNKELQFWYVGARRAQMGTIDTWDLPLAYEFKLREYTCILPGKSLITNIGFDEVAVHTKTPPNELIGNDMTIEPLDFTHNTITLCRDLEYEHLFSKKVYGISILNFFSIYKFWIHRTFYHLRQLWKSGFANFGINQ